MSLTETLIIGIGNRYRSDDALGCIVVDELKVIVPERIRCIEHDGEPAALIESWQEVPFVILVDAVSSGAAAGKMFQFDLANQALPETFNVFSTHAFGIPQAVELARAMGTLPPKIHFFGVEGACFDAGERLSLSVSEAKAILISDILTLVQLSEVSDA